MAVQVLNAGIDVGKERLYIAIWPTAGAPLQARRDAAGFTRIIAWLHQHNVARIGLAATLVALLPELGRLSRRAVR